MLEVIFVSKQCQKFIDLFCFKSVLTSLDHLLISSCFEMEIPFFFRHSGIALFIIRFYDTDLDIAKSFVPIQTFFCLLHWLEYCSRIL